MFPMLSYLDSECTVTTPSSACMQAFNNTRHDFEIQLENASVVQLCEDEPQDAIPRAVYHVGSC